MTAIERYWTSLAAGHAYLFVYALVLCTASGSTVSGLGWLLTLNSCVGVVTFLMHGKHSSPILHVLWFGVLGWLHCYCFAAEQLRGVKPSPPLPTINEEEEEEATLA